MASVDTSELRAFTRELADAPNVVEKQVAAVVSKGALNIKRKMREDARASKHFKGFASAINYDIRAGGAFGGGFVEAEIGPERGKPGSLANIAYFGTSRGGGTVPDPQTALDAEVPQFVAALEKLIGSAL